MPIAFVQTSKEPGFRSMRILGTLTFSGSYVTGGEVPSGVVKPGTTKNAVMASFMSRGDHNFKYDSSTGKVLVYAPGGAQLAAAAYPAGVTGDTVVMELEYPKFG
jgi:hypothetical protein